MHDNKIHVKLARDPYGEWWFNAGRDWRKFYRQDAHPHHFVDAEAVTAYAKSLGSETVAVVDWLEIGRMPHASDYQAELNGINSVAHLL